MSRASWTIGLFAFVAVLWTGCAGALQRNGDVQAESGSEPNFLSEQSGSDAEPEDDLSRRTEGALETLRIKDPQKYAEFKRLLESTDSELPPHLRQAFQDQVAAMLLASEERQGVGQTSGGADDVRLTHRPSRSDVPENPRFLPEVPAASLQEIPHPAQASPPDVEPREEAAVAVENADGSEADAPNDTADPATIQEARHTAGESSSVEEMVPGKWQEHLRTTTETLEKELARFDLDESRTARLNAYLRLLYVIADQRDHAVDPIEGFSDDERQYWKHQLYALLVSLDANDMHTSNRRAALALRDLRAAEDHLSNISTLDVQNLAFCPKVLSFGRYVEYESSTFRPGQEVLLYVEVDNFAVEQKGEEFETHLQGEYSLFDAQNVRVRNVVLPSDEQLCNNRRRDYFIAYRLHLPDDLPAGSYVLQLTIEDVIGKKSNVATIDFRLR